MRLQVNENSEITGYANLGDLTNSIEFNGVIPDDFEARFKPNLFMIKNNVIVDNPNYVEPTDGIPDDNMPTTSDKAIAALTLQMAKQSEKQDEFNAQLLLKLAQLGGETNV